MRTKHRVGILVLLALAIPAAPAHASGIVSVCDEAHLRAALAGGGAVTFTCSGTITLTAEIVIAADTTIDGRGIARPWGPHCDIGAVEQAPIKKLWFPAARAQ